MSGLGGGGGLMVKGTEREESTALDKAPPFQP